MCGVYDRQHFFISFCEWSMTSVCIVGVVGHVVVQSQVFLNIEDMNYDLNVYRDQIVLFCFAVLFTQT